MSPLFYKERYMVTDVAFGQESWGSVENKEYFNGYSLVRIRGIYSGSNQKQQMLFLFLEISQMDTHTDG